MEIERENLMTQESIQSRCDVFNEKNPVGSDVTVILDFGQQKETKVKYPAQILSGHAAVVWLEGISGCYDLSRVV